MNDVLNNMRNALNRKVCRQLIKTMAKNGWEAYELDAGEFTLNGMNLKQKVEEVFEVDGATICFRKNDKIHGVAFDPYNTGIECISDWSYSENDTDGFNAIMKEFSHNPKWEMNQ